ncbi:glycosyltransferase family 2 protein [Labrys sp. LIt4]|uniref:Glycosyltransferase family 2 protein n=1 Tax=Labrys okinawensis TaxID=346911 RepID=A0A2S9QGZ1_9HYPH|nr:MULTISPECIES: glycosyltransferase family A protein [Labrys]MBP0579499.1 glycosyltransferase family 2 protein [Labrys sp. LIt4]PRH88613.1 glycosyltransferase family 2 protein [Labrys okinawensis]
MTVHFSLVMATLGRSEEIALMLDSLETQTFKDFEVIIVDQNRDERVTEVLARKTRPFPIRHLRTPGVPGASRARNNGAKVAHGELLGFPDDDCTYPSWLLEKVLKTFAETGADIVNGRAADETGRSINGRFAEGARWTGARDVFDTLIEWVSFCRREAFEAVGGYDEDVGVGATSPWQACEAPDIVLRMLERGYRSYYDDAIYGHHPEIRIDMMDVRMQQKARGYGRGMGYVLAKHRMGALYSFNYMLRSFGGYVLSRARGQRGRAIYYLNTLKGRLEGYRDGRRAA